MGIDRVLQHEKCAVCYKSSVDYFLSCKIYEELVESRRLKSGERCPWQKVIDEDLEKFVLGYDDLTVRPIVERLIANAPKGR